MGSCFEFICDTCTYKAEVSGGKNRLMMCSTETVSCPHCRKAFDAVYEEYDPPKTTQVVNKNNLDNCPDCESPYIVVWSKAGKNPCPKPKCRGSMIMNPSGPMVMVD